MADYMDDAKPSQSSTTITSHETKSIREKEDTSADVGLTLGILSELNLRGPLEWLHAASPPGMQPGNVFGSWSCRSYTSEAWTSHAHNVAIDENMNGAGLGARSDQIGR
ncbi:hypothetical protein N7492_007110 [Penicillium capsulatum]|uniref:Uncharacterized protein n=1 Tax=Penicillium capsulatum TaxID=69766 RepID=A0A9W9LLH6_9EURO|nr:hypothetical protein N7492_007110 [Penicillium capsulatum]KAJ6116947.1 hypothetical protein N7512_006672 [Penicillium capsulatum]